MQIKPDPFTLIHVFMPGANRYFDYSDRTLTNFNLTDDAGWPDENGAPVAISTRSAQN